MDEEKIAIRAILRHYWKMEYSARKAAEEINDVEGHGCIHERTARIWFKRFNDGDLSLVDKPRSGRPSSIPVDAIREIIKEKPNASSREIAAVVGLSKSTVNLHLNKLGFVSKKNSK